jgi:hypothetical protein
MKTTSLFEAGEPVTGEPRVMTARRSSKCKRCRKWIGPGEEIVFTPGGGSVHINEARCATALPGGPVPAFDRSDPAAYWAEYEAVGRLLEAHPWTFAKTMANIPHWWTVRRQWADSEAFTRAVLRIRQFGSKRRFYSMVNIKMDVNQYYYWTCDDNRCPPEAVTLINRAVRVQYEAEPPAWFPAWPEPTDAERARLARVFDLRLHSVLDIGATWLDAARYARDYVAIGPPGDLARLLTQVPTARTIETAVRGFVPPTRFDIVAALCGAADHLGNDELMRLPLLAQPGGAVIAEAEGRADAYLLS